MKKLKKNKMKFIFFLPFLWGLCQSLCPTGFTAYQNEAASNLYYINPCYSRTPQGLTVGYSGEIICPSGNTMREVYWGPNYIGGCVGSTFTYCPKCMSIKEGVSGVSNFCRRTTTLGIYWKENLISGTPTCNVGYQLTSYSWNYGELITLGCTPIACPDNMILSGLSTTNWCGKTTNVGSYEVCSNIPKVCNAGYYMHSQTYLEPTTIFTGCLPCNAGSYSIQGNADNACSPCPIGTFTESTAQSSCTNCPVGKYSATTGLAACIDCNAGSYSAEEGKSECTTCPIGTISAASAGACDKCLAGSYTTQTGAITCDSCGLGRYNTGLGLSDCPVCPQGTYADTTGLIECLKCPAGTIATGIGEIGCITCGVGKFSSSAGLTTCDNCAIGRYTYQRGSTDCSICSKGSFANTPGSVTCDLCPLSTFAPATETAACTSCPAGTYAGLTGQSQCTPCAIGTFSAAGASVCTPCDKGTFATSTQMSKCTDCAVGKYASKTGQTICDNCAAGTYTNSLKTQTCSNCPAGSFTSTTGNNVCSTCNAGSSSPAGSTACPACSIGSFTASAGQAQCSLCPVASYITTAGASVCLPCPANTYSAAGSQALSNCKSCFTEFLCAYKTSCTSTQCPMDTYQAFNKDTYCNNNANNNNPSTPCLPCKTPVNCVAGQSVLNFQCLGTTTTINQCIACSRGVCPAGLYRRSCTTSIDSTCTLSYTTCPTNQYLVGFGEFTPGTCTPCTNCLITENPIQECSNYKNRICGTACNRNLPCSSNAFCYFLSTNDYGTCSKCPVGYSSNGFMCFPCPRGTICDSNGSPKCEGTCSTSFQPTCTNVYQPCVSDQCNSYQFNDTNSIGIFNNIENNCQNYKVCKPGFYLFVSDVGVPTCTPCTNILSNEEAVTPGLIINNQTSCITQIKRTKTSNNEGFYSSDNRACPSNTVSEQFYATIRDECFLCPVRPSNTFVVPNTPRCEWTCMPGYFPLGAKCEPEINRLDCNGPGLIFTSNGCIMAPIPWQSAGFGYSEMLSITIIPTRIDFRQVLNLGYTSMVDYSSYSHNVITANSLNKRVQGVICSLTWTPSYVYLVFCNTSMIFFWDTTQIKPTSLIGNMTRGYQEGFKNQALFENELYIAAVSSDPNRMIVMDTWNCVVREVVLGPNGPADFRTRSFLLFGTVYNKKAFCIDLITPQWLFPLYGDLVAFINDHKIICQIHTKRRMYKCMINYNFMQTNFTYMSSPNSSTLVLYYTHQTVEIRSTFIACPNDYTSYEGSSCSIYAPYNAGNFGGFYLIDGIPYKCVEPACPLGSYPGICSRNAPANCFQCIIDNPHNYTIKIRSAGACSYDIVHPCPMNMYSDNDGYCQSCPTLMYTLAPYRTSIWDCVCPYPLIRTGSAMCILGAPLFPMFSRNPCPFHEYRDTAYNDQVCYNCKLDPCTFIKTGQYLESCYAQPKACLIPMNARATTRGLIMNDQLSCSWECESEFTRVGSRCVFQACL